MSLNITNKEIGAEIGYDDNVTRIILSVANIFNMLKIVYSRTARFISYLLPTFITNCHMFQRSHLSILLLLLAFSILISTAYILTLYSSQTLPLLSSQVLAGQQNSKLLNLKQINLHLNLIGSTTTGIVNNSSLKSKSVNTAVAVGNLIEKLSDKGMYKVLIRSNNSFVLLPKNGFNMQIVFLNASSSSSPAILIAPSFTSAIMKQLVPVNAFDITIYSNSGKVLWQKTNQTINTATAFGKIAFPNGYAGGGGITIQITNIKPSSVPIGAAIPLLSSSNTSSGGLEGGSANNKRPNDSISFRGLVSK